MITNFSASINPDGYEVQARPGAEPALPVRRLPKPTLHREAPTLAESYDHVVIDGPPGIEATAKFATLTADVVVVPVQRVRQGCIGCAANRGRTGGDRDVSRLRREHARKTTLWSIGS